MYIHYVDKNKISIKKKEKTNCQTPVIPRCMFGCCFTRSYGNLVQFPGIGCLLWKQHRQKAELSINEIVGVMDQAIPEAGHLNLPGK